jgi:TolA-binding protein
VKPASRIRRLENELNCLRQELNSLSILEITMQLKTTREKEEKSLSHPRSTSSSPISRAESVPTTNSSSSTKNKSSTENLPSSLALTGEEIENR